MLPDEGAGLLGVLGAEVWVRMVDANQRMSCAMMVASTGSLP